MKTEHEIDAEYASLMQLTISDASPAARRQAEWSADVLLWVMSKPESPTKRLLSMINAETKHDAHPLRVERDG